MLGFFYQVISCSACMAVSDNIDSLEKFIMDDAETEETNNLNLDLDKDINKTHGIINQNN